MRALIPAQGAAPPLRSFHQVAADCPTISCRLLRLNHQLSQTGCQLLHPTTRLLHTRRPTTAPKPANYCNPADQRLHPGSQLFHPASQLLHPAGRRLHPASPLLHPASQLLHPASQLVTPANQMLHPANQLLHPASQLVHPDGQLLQPTNDCTTHSGHGEITPTIATPPGTIATHQAKDCNPTANYILQRTPPNIATHPANCCNTPHQLITATRAAKSTPANHCIGNRWECPPSQWLRPPPLRVCNTTGERACGGNQAAPSTRAYQTGGTK